MLESSVDNVDTTKELLDVVDIMDMNEELGLVAELVDVTELIKLDLPEDVMTPGMSGVSGALKELAMTRVLGRGKIGVEMMVLGISGMSEKRGVLGTSRVSDTARKLDIVTDGPSAKTGFTGAQVRLCLCISFLMASGFRV